MYTAAWTEKEINILKSMIDKGMNKFQISEVLGRTPDAISKNASRYKMKFLSVKSKSKKSKKVKSFIPRRPHKDPLFPDMIVSWQKRKLASQSEIWVKLDVIEREWRTLFPKRHPIYKTPGRMLYEVNHSRVHKGDLPYCVIDYTEM